MSWNIAPTNPIYIVRSDSKEHEKNALATLSWGLIGPWLKDLKDLKEARGGGQLSIAGVWSSWRAPNGVVIESALIITQEAQGELAEIHSHMPVFMPHQHWRQWLDPENKEIENLRALMVVESPAEVVTAYPVSNAVNSVARNSNELTEPIELGEPETLF